MSATAQTPVTMDDLVLLKRSVAFGDDDVAALRRSGEILADQIEDVLDVWYGFVGSNPHLLAAFARRSDGQPDPDYLAAVRVRFGQWIRDTAEARYDEAWLARQLEIGRRHHRSGKNATDGVDAAEHVPLRDVITLVFPITATLRPFLEKGGDPPERVDAMQDAWRKSVLMQVALWAYPYTREGDW
ncbi:MAG TPA: protoglobin domain-containing protein [Gaiellaceae bacterium]|nr:protoglobin domain-containing protein [Gaiellaceae bacterium]